MGMLEYMDNYGTEEQCMQHLFNSRWPNGFVCPKCGHGEYFHIKSRNLYQCKSCNHQVSVTVCTITDKTTVFVSVSLKEDGNPEYTRMKVVEINENESVDGETALKFADNTIAKGGEVRTDGLNICNTLSPNGYTLNAKKYNPENAPEHLHWTHIIISNAKALIEGTFHGLSAIHLQRYLNEFCYRFNRRWLKEGVFTRLVKASALSSKMTFHELMG